MNKWIKVLIAVVLLFVVLAYCSIWYLNSGNRGPDNTVWQSYIGRDTTVGILPDKYANYFTYTLARTNDNIGLRIKGEFPNTRYFSFNVYSLGDNTTQGSLVDYQISTDSGRPNPFLADADSVDVGTQFTVHIIPEKHKNKSLDNLLAFRDDVKLISVVMRLYDYNVDDFGGVDFPTVEAFSLEENNEEISLSPTRLPKALNLRWIVRRKSLPKMVERLSLLYKTENKVSMDGPRSGNQYYSLPFHAIDTKGFIENNDNRYLLSAITKEDNEIFVFRFKAPTFTTGPNTINQTDVRYWSFNLGNAASYNFNALKDEDAILDSDGFVNIVLSEKDAEIEALANELGFNFLEWNMPWKKALILFRHMLAQQDFEAQIDDVTPIGTSTVDYQQTEAQLFIGDYAPQGIRMSKAEFIEEYSLLTGE